MKLPGQIVSASKLFLNTHQKVQKKIRRPIIFLDITTHPRPSTRYARGHHDWDAFKERIWLDPKLPYGIQEAVAAHELMHVLQKSKGFCQTASVPDARGNPLIPAISSLGTEINGMIMDGIADQWAISRGFKIEDELRTYALPRALADVKIKRPNEQEYINWQAYNADIERITQVVSSGLIIQGPIALRPEVKTQIRAVQYAKLCLRLSIFGLFTELDRLWAEFWPEARSLGQNVMDIAENIGMKDYQTCKTSMIAVIEYLGINPWLICVKQPLTEEVIWPKKK